MSEGIAIALISFAGAVLGAVITGFATIIVNILKGRSDGGIPYGIIGLVALLGAVGGLVLGALFGVVLVQRVNPTPMSMPKPTATMAFPSTPTERQPVTEPTPTPRPTTTSDVIIYILGYPPSSAIDELVGVVSDNGRLEVTQIQVQQGDEIECLGECHYTHCDPPNEQGYRDYYLPAPNGKHTIPSNVQSCIIVPWGR